MATYCECGEVAVIFMDMEGDPLPEPLCSDCFFYQSTMAMEYLPEQEFEDEEEG